MKGTFLGAALPGRSARLVGLVADESNDHAVEVEEEHEQVEAQLDERFLHIVSALYLGCSKRCSVHTFL
jgi:hypothetical protein